MYKKTHTFSRRKIIITLNSSQNNKKNATYLTSHIQNINQSELIDLDTILYQKKYAFLPEIIKKKIF